MEWDPTHLSMWNRVDLENDVLVKISYKLLTTQSHSLVKRRPLLVQSVLLEVSSLLL